MITTEQIELFRNIYPLEFNVSLGKLIEAYRITDICDLVGNEDSSQQTQQLASIVSPLNESVLKYISKKINPNWEYQGGLGFDSMWSGVELEHKLSLSGSNSWTGHPYSNKLPWHLLMKFKLDVDKIKSLFVGMINLETCSELTNWTSTQSPSSSYATLKIHNDDVENIIPIFGGLCKKKKWTSIIFEDI
jgi:hypothetical protein